MEKLKILVIDDELENREAAKKFLKGHDLTILSNPDEAVNEFEKEFFDYDVVLTDFLMPVNNIETAMFLSQEAREKYAGMLMDYGWALLFLAIQKKVKMVGILSNLNCHEHPMVVALAPSLLIKKRERKIYVIEETRFVIANSRWDERPVIPEENCMNCNADGKKVEM